MQHIKGNTLGKGQWLSAKSIFNDKVAKVARILAAKPSGVEGEQRSCTIMALLDGGTLRRHKSWFKVETFHHIQLVVFYCTFNQIDVVTNKWLPLPLQFLNLLFLKTNFNSFLNCWRLFDSLINIFLILIQTICYWCSSFILSSQYVSFFHSIVCSHVPMVLIDAQAQHYRFSNVN
jgi:hypothetical protein